MNQKTSFLSFAFLIVLSFSIFNLSCENKKKNKANDIVIGHSYNGGIVAYILRPGDVGYDAKIMHGIIAASFDQSKGIQWDNGSFIVTGASATAVGAGNVNTNTIVEKQGVGDYAAKLCADLDLEGFKDWYLPSKEELNHLYENKSLIGGFTTEGYWSSSEDNRFGPYPMGQNFGSGSQGSSYGGSKHCVRAVRAF